MESSRSLVWSVDLQHLCECGDDSVRDVGREEKNHKS